MNELSVDAIREKKVLRAKEVAVLMGVGVGWIYRLVQLKKIPHYKRGKCVTFVRDEVEKWMMGERVYTNEERLQMAQTIAMKGANR